MITINLLPYDLRPIKRTPVPYIISFAILALVLAVIGSTFLSNQLKVRAAQNTLEQHRTELANLKPIVDEYNALTRKKLQLAEQVKAIDEIVRDRMIWSRHLFSLNRLLPENMWYNGIRVGTKSVSETYMRENPQTKQMESAQRTAQRPALTITGYVLANAEGQMTVTPLIASTTDDSEFTSMFQLQPPKFESREFEGIPVLMFELEYIIGPGGNQQ